MPSPPTPNLDRFLRAVHRRWVLVRLAERIGQCALIGCAAGLVLVPILLWRGQPALSAAVTVVAVGAAAGFLVGLTRRPDLHAAAAEADRQMDLSDLLATALSARPRVGDDPWAATVIATAEHRCRTLSPDALVLNRLGARAWGGIGLATALLFTLAMMSARPAGTRAGAVARPPAEPPTVHRSHETAGTQQVDPSQIAIPRRPSDPSTDRPFGGGQETPSSPSDQQADTTTPESRNPSQGTAASADGRGTGASRTPNRQPVQTSREPNRETPAPSNPSADPSAEVGRGMGRASSEGAGTEATGQGAVTPDPTGATAPPWTSSSWTTDRAAAEESLRRGATPDAYRDVVREYFDVP